MSIPSLDQACQIVNAASQIFVFFANTVDAGLRGWRIYQTYYEPNMNSIKRWSTIVLDTLSVATYTTSISNLENRQIEQLQTISNITGLGSDAIHILSDANVATKDKTLFVMKALVTANQANGGKREISDFLRFAEVVTVCYGKTEWIKQQMQGLKITLMKETAHRQSAIALETSTALPSAQMEYQNIKSNYRRKFPTANESRVLFLARMHILHQEDTIKFDREECQAIMAGKKITDLKRIPCFLREKFKDRICGISNRPVYTAVTIQTADNSKLIYYEWFELSEAVKDNRRPKHWPASVPFDPEVVVVNRIETAAIRKRLQEAAETSDNVLRAQRALAQLDIQKKETEEVKELSAVDLGAIEVTSKEYMILIDDKLRKDLKEVLCYL